MMLNTETPMQVRLARFQMKEDSEGGKWGTATLTMKIEEVGGLKSPLKDGYKLMKSDTAYEELAIEQKMPNVQLEFTNGAGKGPATKFDPKEIFGFTFRRESSTQAGTLKKDRGSGVDLSLKFTAPLNDCGAWALDNYGDTLTMTIYMVQGELPIAPADPEDPDSQEARNKRVLEGAADEMKGSGVKVSVTTGKKKRGQPSKK
jgi:hypothetical protein